MSGMNSGINVNDPTVVAAFKTALLHQGILILAIFAVLAVAWVSAREWLRPPPAARPAVAPGPTSTTDTGGSRWCCPASTSTRCRPAT